MDDKIGFMVSTSVLDEMLQRSPRSFGQELGREIAMRYTDQIRRALQGAQTYAAVAEALAEFAEIRIYPTIPNDAQSLAAYAASADKHRERQAAELDLWRAIARHEGLMPQVPREHPSQEAAREEE